MRKPRALHAGSRHPTHAGARDDLEKETPLKKRRGSHYTPFEKLPAKKVGAIDEGPPGQEKHKSCIRWGDSPALPYAKLSIAAVEENHIRSRSLEPRRMFVLPAQHLSDTEGRPRVLMHYIQGGSKKKRALVDTARHRS